MRALAIVPMILFLLTTSVVGLRLLGLARRTRELPEAAIGGGLTLIGLVGLPLSALGRLPATLGTPLGDASFVAGISVAHAGIGLLYLFTFSVFRRDAAAAKVGLCLAAACLLGVAMGLGWNGIGDTDLQRVLPKTRPWALATVGLVALAFLWSGLESLHYYAMLRRRLRLGLSDAVVTNRFGLWATVGIASALLCSVLAVCLGRGMSILTELVPMLTCALMGTLASLAFYLSFLPPARYLAAVRARSVDR